MLDYINRNLMTLATILISVSAAIASAAGAVPGDAGMQLATWSIVAGAAGRAFVHAATEIRQEYAHVEVELDAESDG